MKSINAYVPSEDRPRRLRQTPGIRRLAAENHLTSDGLVMPVFVQSGQDICLPIKAMPGIFRYSVDRLAGHLSDLDAAGVRTLLLFGIPEEASKDACGSAAHDPDGPVQAAIRLIRSQYDHFVVFADICLCEYTSHGHCGLLDTDQRTIDNDRTLPELAAAA
ncbi:MAG: porphobilinogen synthase, partial [Clostridia bacterium]|nr:porphobilinogen synthase [Clostridia bacterium]